MIQQKCWWRTVSWLGGMLSLYAEAATIGRGDNTQIISRLYKSSTCAGSALLLDPPHTSSISPCLVRRRNSSDVNRPLPRPEVIDVRRKSYLDRRLLVAFQDDAVVWIRHALELCKDESEDDNEAG